MSIKLFQWRKRGYQLRWCSFRWSWGYGRRLFIGLGGEVVDCNNGKIIVGGLDYNLDGIIDYWFDTASGNMNICGEKLKITNLILDGDCNDDVVATYVGVARSAIQADQIDSAQTIIAETLDRLRD